MRCRSSAIAIVTALASAQLLALGACADEAPTLIAPPADPPAIDGPAPARSMSALASAAAESRSVAHVVVTATTAHRIDDFPHVATDVSLEVRSIVAGEKPPASFTVAGGRTADLIAETPDAPVFRPGQHLVGFFQDGPGGTGQLRLALPASAAGEVEVGGEMIPLAELEAALAELEVAP